MVKLVIYVSRKVELVNKVSYVGRVVKKLLGVVVAIYASFLNGKIICVYVYVIVY